MAPDFSSDPGASNRVAGQQRRRVMFPTHHKTFYLQLVISVIALT
jgi:hypothetical protein